MKGITADALYLDLCADLLPWSTLEGAPEQSAQSFAAAAQRDALTKKLVTSVAKDADELALRKFLQVNDRCRDWQLKVERLEDELLLGELKACLHSFFNESSTTPLLGDIDGILSHGTLGPGVSIGCESEDFYTKLFDSQLSTTSNGLFRLYEAYIRCNPSWVEAEKFRQGCRGQSSIVRGNRLTFVPKNDEISRTICIEPVLNMFFQQGIKFVLEKRLRAFFGIDLALQQQKNRTLAKIGSERAACSRRGGLSDHTDLVTIDLSSASDSLANSMLDAVMPSFSLSMLNLCRCPEVELPDGSWRKLEMISTMGNAFTFPLQTILFASIVFAAARVSGLPGDFRGTLLSAPYGSSLGNFAVNGDDIICPLVIADKVLRLLTLLGFQVNGEKTFGTHNTTSLFRESCGADFYAGSDVRPVFCKNLGTPQDLYSLLNRLNEWSFRKGIPLRKTMHRLLRAVPRYEVPPWEAVDSGIRVPLLRWCRGEPKRKQGSILYKRWVPHAPKASIDTETEVIWTPARRKPMTFNRSGLYLAFLRGTIVNGCITFRPRVTVYTTKTGVAPNWECSPTAPSPYGSVGGPGIENLVCVTL